MLSEGVEVEVAKTGVEIQRAQSEQERGGDNSKTADGKFHNEE